MADSRSALPGKSPDVPLRHADRMRDHLPKRRLIIQHNEKNALSTHAASISSDDQCPCAVNDGSCETPETLAARTELQHSGWFRKDGTKVLYCELSMAKRGHKASLPLGRPPKGRPHRSMEHRLQKARMPDMVMGCNPPDESHGNAGAAVQHSRCQEGLIGDGGPSLDDITVSNCNAASVALGISTVPAPELGATTFTCIGHGSSGPCLHFDDSDSAEMHGGTCGVRQPHVGFNQKHVVCKLVDEMFGAATRCMSPVELPTTASPTPPVSTSCSSRPGTDMEEKEAATMHCSSPKPLAESHHPEQQAECFGDNHVLAHFRREARGYLRTRLPPLDLNIDCDTHKTIGEMLAPAPEYMESAICASRHFENLDSAEVSGDPASRRRRTGLHKDHDMDQISGEMLVPNAQDISPSAPAAAPTFQEVNVAHESHLGNSVRMNTCTSTGLSLSWAGDMEDRRATEPVIRALYQNSLAGALRPGQQAPCHVGSRIMAPFQMTNRWYPGVVEEVYDDGQATIRWDDGDKKDRLKLIAQLQVFQPFTEFFLGQTVLARARDVGELLQAKLAFGGGPWYLAIITSVNVDGNFEVEWVDRDKKGRTVRCDELWALSDDQSVATFNQVVRQPRKASRAKDKQICPFARLLADAQRRDRQKHRTTSQKQQLMTTLQRQQQQRPTR